MKLAHQLVRSTLRAKSAPRHASLNRHSPLPMPPRKSSVDYQLSAEPSVISSRASEAQKRLSLSPFAAALTHSASRKSFPCHSYANTRDGCATPPKISSPPLYLMALNPFRINTCESVSKQRTLSTFKINTCKKQGGGVLPILATRYSRPITSGILLFFSGEHHAHAR